MVCGLDHSISGSQPFNYKRLKASVCIHFRFQLQVYIL